MRESSGPSTGPRTHDMRPRRVNPYRSGPDPADDVRVARDAVTRTDTGYGRRSRRTNGDRLHDFVARWGWRAYAIPVLAVITVVALANTESSGQTPTAPAAAHRGVGAGSSPAATPTPTTGSPSNPAKAPVLAPTRLALKSDTPGADAVHTIPKGFSLPAGGPYTVKGDGTFRVLKGTTPVIGRTGRVYRFSIDVENGVRGIDLTQFQKLVVATLSNGKSWSGHGIRLQRVDSGHIDFHVTLTSAMTVRKLCGYTIPVETSCYAPASGGTTPVNRVVFDDARWVRGAVAYLGDLTAYREYMINHEDGHALGHEHAHQCLPGGLAPTMMQQTFGLRSSVTKQLCRANPWPFPTGVAIGPNGAPGAEQPDTDKNNEYYIGD